MPEISTLLAFSCVALGMVLTPGPNMIYLVSRTMCQGRAAGLMSLAGVALGFVFYMLCAVFGLTAMIMVVPFAYDSLRLLGAAYMLYLAWQAVKPGGRSVFQVRQLTPDRPRQLFLMGFMTNVLNPKVAMLYLSLLPQFIHPEKGNVWQQSIILGSIQILLSLSINALILMAASSITAFLANRPTWLVVQRWLMGTVLAGLAVRIALEQRK